jgi:ubiquinone/menaquinone biosynthesis C-methylase UbiE
MTNYILFNNPSLENNKLQVQLDVMKNNKEKLGDYKTFSNYVNICDWMIRRQEYNFAIDVFEEYENLHVSQKFKVLDIGCGVVPLCNYISLKGHEVIALDPIKNDIEFLVKNDMNSIHKSNVNYMHGYGEKLPFEDNSFDVVYSVSVLEHIASGNDLVVLSEMLRVLKVGGRLILTTDVMPKDGINYRKYTYPFTSNTLLAILDFISNYGDIDEKEKKSLLNSLDNLTWEQVHNFWIDSKKSDQREEDQREYLAVGFFLDKKYDFVLNEDAKTTLFLQGQNVLIEGFYYYQDVATVREKEMIAKEKVIQQLIQIKDNFENNFYVKVLRKLGLIK